MNQSTIGFIGAGNMAFAISGKLAQPNVLVYDVEPAHCLRFTERGAVAVSSIAALIARCDYVFLSVKPQNFEEVLCAIQQVGDHNRCVYVSIAAGISTDYIASFLGDGCRVVRAMPNTPLLVGFGATALCQKNTTAAQFAAVQAIFDHSGITEQIPEEQMNDVIALNGSSPAYAYYFIEAIIEGAVKAGFDEETAKRMACATVRGSLEMILQTGCKTGELIDMVCSKGGTTLAAMEILREQGFKKTVQDAMDACTHRAKEIAR